MAPWNLWGICQGDPIATPFSIPQGDKAHLRYASQEPSCGSCGLLGQASYEGNRSIPGLYRLFKRLHMTPVKPPVPKYLSKPYEAMLHPGQKIQIDVKFVSSVCLSNPDLKGERFYQYTAIWRMYPLALRWGIWRAQYLFIRRLLQQTRYKLKDLLHRGITARSERSHRKDNERFYATYFFHFFDGFRKQLKLYNHRDYNNFSMRSLGRKSPSEVLHSFLVSV